MCHAQGATDFTEDVGTISVIGRGARGDRLRRRPQGPGYARL